MSGNCPLAHAAGGSIQAQAAAFDQFQRLRALGLDQAAPASSRARRALVRAEKCRLRFDAVACRRWQEAEAARYVHAVTCRLAQADRMRDANARIEVAEFQLHRGPKILSHRERTRAMRRDAAAQWADAASAAARATQQARSLQDRLVARLDAKGLDALLDYRAAFSAYIDALAEERRR